MTFVESAYTTEMFDDLLAACEAGDKETGSNGPQLLRAAAYYLDDCHAELCGMLQDKADAEETAIAKAKGEERQCWIT